MTDQTGIALRALEPEDVDCIYLWENDPDMWIFGAARAPYSRQQIWDYITGYDADPFHAGQLRLMITKDGKPAGIADLYDIDCRNRNAMVGIMVCKTMRRAGVGTGALRELMRFCKANLALNGLAAVVSTANIPSVSLFKKAGFYEAGRLRNWLWQPDGTFADACLFCTSL